MDFRDRLVQCIGFEWDRGNISKNWEKHPVAFWEAEEVFFNEPLIVGFAGEHYGPEQRHSCLGKSDAGRMLFLVFTLRHQRIRVISVRDMSRTERRIHKGHEEEKNPSL